MKTVTIVAGIMLVFTACRKFDPGFAENRGSPGPIPLHDTIPDKAAIKVKLFADGTNYDETELLFNHNADTAFNPAEDAPYLQGFGQVSLASISCDGRDLTIAQLPYRPDMAIGLDVNTLKEGTFSFKVSFEHKIPGGIEIWLKDRYENNTVNLRHSTYSFQVNKADTNTFGHRRFRLILTDRKQHYNGDGH